MTVLALPDVAGGIVQRLCTFPEVLAFVSTSTGYTQDATVEQRATPRIATQLQAFWALPKFALLIEGPVGSPGDDRDVAIEATRFDFHCYGPNKYEALRFWRTVHPALCPPPHQGRDESLFSAGCRFYTVDKEGGPNRLLEPETAFWKVVATYVFRWGELAP